jgi:pimeloyl-ACP methyl ester carboxylesterase
VRGREIDIAVDGGLLHVGVWGPDSGDVPVVLAVHGITASYLSWAPVARQLTDVRLIAPDLRGRGRSADLPGPWGMARHAEDLARVVKALAAPEVLVAGHSMGAFVAVVFNHMCPALARQLLLVDGGLPLPLPPNLNAEQLTIAGPHRLCHALAAELLPRGASLVAIGRVLRHQDLATIALYAKVDLATLRMVA